MQDFTEPFGVSRLRMTHDNAKKKKAGRSPSPFSS
jgi:hypothetical protein